MARTGGGVEVERTCAWVWAWSARPILPVKPHFFARFIDKAPVDAGAIARTNTKARNGTGI